MSDSSSLGSLPTGLPPLESFGLPPSPAPPPVEPTVADPPVRRREVVAAVAAATLFDLLVYRAGGYAAAGLLFVSLAAVFAVASPFGRANWRGFWCVAGLLGLVAVRLAWLGWFGAAFAGVVLLAGLSIARSGRSVWVIDLPVQWFQLAAASPAALIAWRALFAREAPPDDGGPDSVAAAAHDPGHASPLAVLLPVAAGATFAGLFVLANPDLKATVGGWFGSLSDRFGDYVAWVVPGPGQAFLWAVAFGLTAGALRPLVRASLLDPLAEREREIADRRRSAGPAASAAFPAVRNTLLAVVGVFAAYLPYEFLTLWRRDLPAGFYYAGYAHEGAAWLTVALAAATVLLGAMFRGSLTADPRAGQLRLLAYVWSGLNALLVAAVVNRLAIYVGYNGLSRLRVVGFLGIAAVALGFAAVVVKVARDRGFTWLVRRQLRAAALVVLAGVLLPVDFIAHRYNAARVVAGDPAPLALVGNHEIDLGGLLALEPVLRAENELAARGVAGRMRLAEKGLQDAESRDDLAPPETGPLARLGRFQLAEVQFRRMLTRNEERIDALLTGTTPDRAANRLGRYGMRWW